MKAKITRLGETIELEGTAEELERFIKPAAPSISIQTVPYIPAPTIVPFPWVQPVDIQPFIITNPAIQPCTHEYPNPWMGTVPPSCKKCGASEAFFIGQHTTILCSNNSSLVH